MALCRLKFLTDELLLNEETAGLQEALKELLEVSSEYFESLTGRKLENATYTDELYTGHGRRNLWLRQYPIISITEISIWDGVDSYDVETASFYSLREDSSGEKRFVAYPVLGTEDDATFADWVKAEPDNIKVTYLAGYVTTGWDTVSLAAPVSFAVPKDLEYAVGFIAAMMWLDSVGGDKRLGLKSISEGGAGMIERTVFDRLPPQVKQTVAKYRRRVG